MKGDQPLFFDVLKDKNFRGLLRESQRHAITWDELLEHPLPAGLSPRQTNAVLESFGRCLGVHLFENMQGNLLWYRRTYELEQLVSSINSLNTSIKTFLIKNPHAFASDYSNKLLYKEANAALEFAQLYYSESEYHHPKQLDCGKADHCSKINRSSLQQSDITDKLIDSFNDLHRSISTTQYPLTRETLEHFAMELIERSEIRKKASTSVSKNRMRLTSSHPLSVPYFDGPKEEQMHYQRLIDELCIYGSCTDNYDDLTILKGILVGSTIMRQSAFGFITPFLASLVTHLIHDQMNENVLAYLPLLPAFLAWRKEEIGNFCVQSYSSYALTSAQTPNDVTLFQTINAQCILFTLKHLHERLMRHTERTTILSKNLDKMQNLNARQRRALISLVDKNMGSITIQDYQRRYKTSYATARRDLLDLEGRSLLESHFEKKALAFKISPELLAFTIA